MSEGDDTSSSSSTTASVRPYTSYNLFYQLERSYILQMKYHQPTVTPNDIIFNPIDRSNYQGPPLPTRYRNLVLPHDWHIPGKTRRRKRVHRKTHGCISFHEMNDCISSSWKAADDEVKNFCKVLADMEAVKYNKKLNKPRTKRSVSSTASSSKKTKKKKAKDRVKHHSFPTEEQFLRVSKFAQESTKIKRRSSNYDEAVLLDNLIADTFDCTYEATNAATTTTQPTSLSRSYSETTTAAASVASTPSRRASSFTTVDMKDEEIINLWHQTHTSSCHRVSVKSPIDTSQRRGVSLSDGFRKMGEQLGSSSSAPSSLLPPHHVQRRNCYVARQA